MSRLRGSVPTLCRYVACILTLAAGTLVLTAGMPHGGAPLVGHGLAALIQRGLQDAAPLLPGDDAWPATPDQGWLMAGLAFSAYYLLGAIDLTEP